MNKTWTIIVGAMGAVLMVLLTGFGAHVIGQLDEQSKDINRIKIDIAAIKTRLNIPQTDDAMGFSVTNRLAHNYVLITGQTKQ